MNYWYWQLSGPVSQSTCGLGLSNVNERSCSQLCLCPPPYRPIVYSSCGWMDEWMVMKWFGVEWSEANIWLTGELISLIACHNNVISYENSSSARHSITIIISSNINNNNNNEMPTKTSHPIKSAFSSINKIQPNGKMR